MNKPIKRKTKPVKKSVELCEVAQNVEELNLDTRIERGWVRLMDRLEQSQDLTIREEVAILLAFERMQYRRIKKGSPNVGVAVRKYEHEFAARNVPNAAAGHWTRPEPEPESELTDLLVEHDELVAAFDRDSEPDA